MPGAKGFPLGADPAFAAALRRALDLPARSLAQPTPAGQASAARRIAADLRAARAKVARAKAGPADEPLRADLTRRLAAIAAAYGDLADAAAQQRPRRLREGGQARPRGRGRAAPDPAPQRLRRPRAARPLDPGAAPPARAAEAQADSHAGPHARSRAPRATRRPRRSAPSPTPDPDRLRRLRRLATLHGRRELGAKRASLRVLAGIDERALDDHLRAGMGESSSRRSVVFVRGRRSTPW